MCPRRFFNVFFTDRLVAFWVPYLTFHNTWTKELWVENKSVSNCVRFVKGFSHGQSKNQTSFEGAQSQKGQQREYQSTNVVFISFVPWSGSRAANQDPSDSPYLLLKQVLLLNHPFGLDQHFQTSYVKLLLLSSSTRFTSHSESIWSKLCLSPRLPYVEANMDSYTNFLSTATRDCLPPCVRCKALTFSNKTGFDGTTCKCWHWEH